MSAVAQCPVAPLTGEHAVVQLSKEPPKLCCTSNLTTRNQNRVEVIGENTRQGVLERWRKPPFGARLRPSVWGGWVRSRSPGQSPHAQFFIAVNRAGQPGQAVDEGNVAKGCWAWHRHWSRGASPPV